MDNVHVLSGAPVRRSARKRIALAAIIATAIVLLGTASIASFGEFSAKALSEASAKSHRAVVAESAALKSASERGTDAAPARDFDYFLDHYRNRATEPAEPIATF